METFRNRPGHGLTGGGSCAPMLKVRQRQSAAIFFPQVEEVLERAEAPEFEELES